jgi:integral membrane sensor domain MASE1
LAKLTMVGLASQGLALLGTRSIPKWSPFSIAAGATLFLAFWDQNNWMLIGSVLILAGLMPIRKRLLSDNERET